MQNQKRMSISRIFLSFFKIGVIGFGGGSALIPVVEKELVQDQKAITDQDYLKHTVVANITPGALPVKLGATCGYQLKGVGGALAGAYGVAFPGVLLTVAFMALFSILGAGAINYFNYASIGITAFIVFLLASYVVKTVKLGDQTTNLIICLTAFILTGGKEIREIAALVLNIDHQVLGTPVFDIPTIDLIILAFFVILLLDKLKSRAELLAALMLSTAYAFFVGKTGKVLGLSKFKGVILLIMIATAVILFVARRNTSGKKSKISFGRSDIAVIALFLIIPAALAIIAQIMFSFAGEQSLTQFLTQVASSTVTSFGGGEAYVSVADGIFVQGGYIEADKFYTRLVPVANSLPGPILVKIASGIGYIFGDNANGPAAAWCVALIAGALAIGACSALAILIMKLYDSVKQWQFITDLKKYILPVICGMLISTSGAMIFESMKIASEKGIAGVISLPAILLSVYGINLLHKKFHLHDVLLLLIAAATSLGILLVI